MMDAESLVLAVLSALPSHEVRGRKRLQKMAFFAAQTGAESNARFFLHDFGPFSSEVAAATNLLSWAGDIEEEAAQFERTKRYYSVYRLHDLKTAPQKLPEKSLRALRELNEYSTIELEIASTIRYFLTTGLTLDGAIEATKKLKPNKSGPQIIQRAKDALVKVGLYERGRAD